MRVVFVVEEKKYRQRSNYDVGKKDRGQNDTIRTKDEQKGGGGRMEMQR